MRRPKAVLEPAESHNDFTLLEVKRKNTYLLKIEKTAPAVLG
jgi:hypothetical protein